MSNESVIDASERFATGLEPDEQGETSLEMRLLGLWSGFFATETLDSLTSVRGLAILADIEQKLVGDYGLSPQEASEINQAAMEQAMLNSQDPSVAPVLRIVK